MESLEIVHAACPLDCPDACGVRVSVNGKGRAVKIQGDPDHPATRGFLCDRGAIRLRARVNGEINSPIPAGVAACRLGWNKLSGGGIGVNVLTSEALTDMGGGPTFYSTLVEVRRV